MNKDKIENRLAEGNEAIVLSTPFSTLKLRTLAKSALQGNTKLTIIVGPNLTDTDIDNILAEAPAHVIFDYSQCKF